MLTSIVAELSKHKSFNCAYFDYEGSGGESPDEKLAAARDGSLQKTQGTLITEERIEVSGHPALDIQAHTRGNSILDARYIVAGRRIYMLAAVETIPSDRDEKTIARFIDSFKVLNETGAQ